MVLVVLVSLSVEGMGLCSHVLLSVFFFDPPLLEHVTLFADCVCFSLSIDLASVLLPVTHSHSLRNSLCLLSGLSDLSLVLFLCIKSPQLRVHMLLFQCLVYLSPLVNELLLALNLRPMRVEMGILLTYVIGGGLEALIHTAVHLGLAFAFTLILQVGAAFVHLFADLLWRL